MEKLNTIEMIQHWADNNYKTKYKMIESTVKPLLVNEVEAYTTEKGSVLCVLGNEYNPISIANPLTTYWEEVKPPRQWSEKELMLFKLLPDWAKWIAKDKSGCIWIFEDIPTLKEISGFYDSIHRSTRITYFDFITITFEESPIYIGDLKGE